MHVGFIEDTHLHGGTQIWVSDAMRAFLAAGHEVSLLTAADGFNAKDAVDTAAHVCTYDFNDVVAQDAHHQTLWTEALAPTDVAICTVHPPRHGFHCSIFAAKCIAEAGLQTVLEPKTGTIVPEYLTEFYRPSEDIRYHVISITDFTRRYLIETYGIPDDHVSLVYQGTDLSSFTPDEVRAADASQRYPVPPGAFPVLGNVGSFEQRKGQVILLEALERAREHVPDVHLLFVGDGPDEELLKRKVAESDLGRHVSFFPFTREPTYVFEAIDVLVLSSTEKEGLPNVLLEALAMARPVVSSRLAGTPEVVHDEVTGLLVEPGDIEQLAAAIVRLGTDPDVCRQMGVAGQRLMHKTFDKQRQFDAFLDHFTTVIES